MATNTVPAADAARKEIQAIYAGAAARHRGWERSIEGRFARESMSVDQRVDQYVERVKREAGMQPAPPQGNLYDDFAKAREEGVPYNLGDIEYPSWANTEELKEMHRGHLYNGLCRDAVLAAARRARIVRNVRTRIGWHMLVCDCGCGATWANPGTILGGERRNLVCRAERERRTAEHRAEVEAYRASPEGQAEAARQRAYNARPLQGDNI